MWLICSLLPAYIKELDPYHMISVGCEGFFNEPGNADWAYNGADGELYGPSF